MVLLMAEILHHLGCKKPVVKNGIINKLSFIMYLFAAFLRQQKMQRAFRFTRWMGYTPEI